ncbi:unnamed protein product [Didymodactylos carnosus]|uniref:Uncharacterized protein n=1 Tax=Didymodactylos carnosus TaxID=1234261 RepID=A0A8S2VLW2_9BILA|nr:unnamed protein product [Didymodactylos carnosus]CAF4378087.1 unnamed protein product [Didymodactylos carnosus]
MSSSQPHSSQYQQQQQQQQRQRSLENSFSVSELSEFDCDAANQPIAATAAQISWITRLPPCNMWLDEDNPFLLFLCISIMLTHRTYLLKQNNLDEQDIAMYFDRYRRRHHADQILNCTRTLYSQYIQWSRKKRMIDDLSQFSAS